MLNTCFAGVIQATGLVRCAQSEGGPVNHECSLSEYEKLGYSKERRPGENVHLTNFSLALKVWHQTVPSLAVLEPACTSPITCKINGPMFMALCMTLGDMRPR